MCEWICLSSKFAVDPWSLSETIFHVLFERFLLSVASRFVAYSDSKRELSAAPYSIVELHIEMPPYAVDIIDLSSGYGVQRRWVRNSSLYLRMLMQKHLLQFMSI